MRTAASSTYRDEEHWRYLLTKSKETDTGSDYWIFEDRESQECFYCRIPYQGFGQGLIVSEVSAGVSYKALTHFFPFWKKLAQERNKPHLRLNLPNDSEPVRYAAAMGVAEGRPYAWQVRFVDRLRFVKKMKPILQRRLAQSNFADYTGTLRLELFQEQIDLHWQRGTLSSVTAGSGQEVKNTFCINPDLFPALCLGHRTWRELQSIRPDIFPARQYENPIPFPGFNPASLLMDILFPRQTSWIHEQY